MEGGKETLMGRGPKPANAKPAVSRKSQKREDARVRDLEQRVAEVLNFDAIAQSARMLCCADFCVHLGSQAHATAEDLQVIRPHFPSRQEDRGYGTRTDSMPEVCRITEWIAGVRPWPSIDVQTTADAALSASPI